jgi:hypothetical protein
MKCEEHIMGNKHFWGYNVADRRLERGKEEEWDGS